MAFITNMTYLHIFISLVFHRKQELLNENMKRGLTVSREVHLIICFCGSLNYLIRFSFLLLVIRAIKLLVR